MDPRPEAAGWPLRWKVLAVLACAAMAAAVAGVVFVVRGLLMDEDSIEVRLAKSAARHAELVESLAANRARLAAGRLHEFGLRERLGAATQAPPAGPAVQVLVDAINAAEAGTGLGAMERSPDGRLVWGEHVVDLWREPGAPGTRFTGTWTVVVRPRTGAGEPVVLARSGETISWRRAGPVRLVRASEAGGEPLFEVDPRVIPANGWVPQ